MQKEYGGLLITISVTVTRLFPLKMACYCITNAREIDQGDAGQSAECRRLVVAPLGNCSANKCALKGRTLNQVRSAFSLLR